MIYFIKIMNVFYYEILNLYVIQSYDLRDYIHSHTIKKKLIKSYQFAKLNLLG